MTDKELRRLSRSELLEMLIAQTEENRQLKIRLERAEAQLRDRRIAVEKAGSLAEAALQLNRVFEAADKAAQQYLENVRLMSEKGSGKVMKSNRGNLPSPRLWNSWRRSLAEKYKRRYKRVLRSTVYTLVVVAAVAVLVATIWMPVLQIYGSSMMPTLNEGDIVLSVKGSGFEPGDLVAFYLETRFW